MRRPPADARMEGSSLRGSLISRFLRDSARVLSCWLYMMDTTHEAKLF